MMVVYGRQAVREALRGRRSVRRVWATESAARALGTPGVPVELASPPEVEARAGSSEHQGLCAEVEPYPYAGAAGLLSGPDALVVALDEVQDPHNLGAVCRIAECAGAAGVVIPERRAAQVTPAVCRASAGAVEHLAIARVRNLADWLGVAKQVGAWVYGTVLARAVPYDRPDYRGRVVLVLGSEGRGVRPRVAAACDELVRLPVHGRIESLNVSAAAAALVYGVLHFRAAGA
ncbi:MAG TPA: 23S rRNA (guanosine(2251)-2'-O)-methyltransferase RlmB [Thermoleophilaceae bacterium]|nr:23S rRNA (guanosine(2251)-2'-O)-methyltransferase RlmB [Thermoleophilaceae bacterium]